MPEEKIVKLMHSIDSVLATWRVPAHLLASITGQVISMSLAIGPMARLRTRALYEVVNQARRQGRGGGACAPPFVSLIIACHFTVLNCMSNRLRLHAILSIG